MSKKITCSAQPRTIIGKQSKRLRWQKSIPANVSGNVSTPLPITLDAVGFTKLYEQVGDTGLFYLTIDGEKTERPVLVDDVQYHPVSEAILHVVLRQVNLSEKVSAEVPVEVVGGLAVKDAVVVTVHPNIEVTALPQDLPEKFVVDVSTFVQVGDVVTFLQLAYDKEKVTLEVEEDQLSTPVVMVQALKGEVEEVVVETPTPDASTTPAAASTEPAAAEPAKAA